MPAGAEAAFPGAAGEIVVSERGNLIANSPRGGGERTIVDGSKRPHTVAVSPDGRTVAYVTHGYGRDPNGIARYFSRFMLKRVRGANTGPGHSIWPRAGRWYVHSLAFAPGGNRLIYSSAPQGRINPGGDLEIFSVKLDGSGKIRLTDNKVHDFDPVYSPDGRSVAFSRALLSREYHSTDGVAIFRMRPRGGGQQRLTTGQFADTDPDFSPNGRTIVFSRFRSGGAGPSGYGDHQIWVMNRAGRVEHRRLISETNINLTEPAFSPAGDAIAAIGYGYSGGEYHSSDLFVIGGNGRLRKVGSGSSYYQALDWGPAPGTAR